MDWIPYCLALGLVKLFQALPLRVVARIGRGGGALAYWVDRRHRRVAASNLAQAFPEKSPRAVMLLVKEHFRRLGENYSCAVKTATMSPEELRRCIDFRGAEELGKNADKPQSCVFAIGHFGNFELYARGNLVLGDYQLATTYRALSQPRLNQLLLDLRSRSGCLLFERRMDGDQLRQAMKHRQLILGFLSDQHAGKGGEWVPFFGRMCSTTAAPAVFALRYKLPLYTAVCYRTALAHWRIEVGQEIPTFEAGQRRPVADILIDVNEAFERAVRRDPANWFWVHKRWKPPGPGARLHPVRSTEQRQLAQGH